LRRPSLATETPRDGPAFYDDLIVAKATPTALDEVHAALDRCWQALDALPRPPATAWRDLFRTAVAEIATNIVRHAYPPDSPRGGFRLRLRIEPEGLVASFTDEGIEWDQAHVKAEVDPFSLPEGGLGLIVARAALDNLEYQRDAHAGENAWRLMKRFGEAA
jgi:anti-sigma regulatory factor (Ser/Thr protein kinase)